MLLNMPQHPPRFPQRVTRHDVSSGKAGVHVYLPSSQRITGLWGATPDLPAVTRDAGTVLRKIRGILITERPELSEERPWSVQLPGGVRSVSCPVLASSPNSHDNPQLCTPFAIS